jgi:hypothetical protein
MSRNLLGLSASRPTFAAYPTTGLAVNTTPEVISRTLVEHLLELANATISALPEDAQWTPDGDFEPFALAARGGDSCFLDAPLLCSADDDVAAEGWQWLDSRLRALAPDAAVLALPMWVAPDAAERPSAHAERVEAVALAALGLDGFGRVVLHHVARADASYPRLGPANVSSWQDLSVSFPQLAQSLAEADALQAFAMGPPQLLSAADIPEHLRSAKRMLGATCEVIDRQLAAGVLTRGVRFELVAPNGLHDFGIAPHPPGPPTDPNEFWHLQLPELARQTEATGLILYEVGRTLDGGHGHARLRVTTVSHEGEALQASRSLVAPAPAGTSVHLWDEGALTGHLPATVLSAFGRVRTRQRAFEQTLEALGRCQR